jgi:hypothetical protein
MTDTTLGLTDGNHPSWLTKPCPKWCAAKTSHREEDLPDDRLHYSSWQRFIALPSAEPVMIGQPPTRQQRQLIIYVEQHVDEDEPRVIVTDAHSDKQERRFNVDEATGVAVTMLHAISIITGDGELLGRAARANAVTVD